MNCEPALVVLTCSRCGLESLHRVSYVGPILMEVACASCGLITRNTHDEIYHAYLHELESRVRSKPRRVLRAATRSPREFTLHLPYSLLTKPYRLGEELASLHHLVRSGRE
jgi:hypothetical protein